MQQETPLERQQANQLLAVASLARRAKSGGNNFYWIAGLSVVNSLILAFQGGITFVIGLGITQLVDAFASVFAEQAPDGALIFKGLGLVLSIIISGIFALFGFLAGKDLRWAFITGMVLYTLDTVLLLVFTDWFGLAFHLFFLWNLWGGLQALNQLREFSTLASPPASGFSKDIGVS
jgi:hypothetical protein